MTTTMLLNHQGLETHYVSLSQEIRKLLLEAFIDGDLTPGTRVNDLEVAKRLGVSRTPVREALRGLQSLGIIETLPARITRVATLPAREIAHAQVVWSSLYRVLLADTLHRVQQTHVDEMLTFHEHYSTGSTEKRATHTFRLFSTLVPLTENTLLQESIFAAACKMHLGYSTMLNDPTVHSRVKDTQLNFVAAISDGHLNRACDAISAMMPAAHKPSGENADNNHEEKGITAPTVAERRELWRSVESNETNSEPVLAAG